MHKLPRVADEEFDAKLQDNGVLGGWVQTREGIKGGGERCVSFLCRSRVCAAALVSILSAPSRGWACGRTGLLLQRAVLYEPFQRIRVGKVQREVALFRQRVDPTEMEGKCGHVMVRGVLGG
jgi:hypothetical protein